MDPVSSQKNATQKAALPQQQTNGQPPVPNRSSNSFVLFIGALGVVICIMVGVIVYKHSSSQKHQGAATPLSSNGTNATQPNSSTPPVGGVVFIPVTPPNTWKPYTSATYHYSLKYPSDWKNIVSAGGQSLALSSPDGVGITIAVVPTKRTSVYAQFVQEAKTANPGATLPHTETTINGIRAIQYTSGTAQQGQAGQTTLLVTGGYAYHIMVTYPDQQKEESAQSIYKQLLSSFTYLQ